MLNKKILFLSVFLFFVGFLRISDAFAECTPKTSLAYACEGEIVCRCTLDYTDEDGVEVEVTTVTAGACSKGRISCETVGAVQYSLPELAMKKLLQPAACESGCINVLLPTTTAQVPGTKCVVASQTRLCIAPNTFSTTGGEHEKQSTGGNKAPGGNQPSSGNKNK